MSFRLSRPLATKLFSVPTLHRALRPTLSPRSAPLAFTFTFTFTFTFPFSFTRCQTQPLHKSLTLVHSFHSEIAPLKRPQKPLLAKPTFISQYEPKCLQITSLPPRLLLAQNLSSERTKQLAESQIIKEGLSAKLIKKLPTNAQQYFYLMRLDKPIGTMLLFWPGAWSILMAAASQNFPLSQTLLVLSYFGTGAVIMRGAGCIINDMWDTDFDKKVARTAERPLASGKISMRNAQYLLVSQLSLGLMILVQMNTTTILYGALSLPIVALYPFMKRITFWPQAVLGLAFNWGALLGWIAMTGSPNWAVTVPLYAAGIAWTLIYDTVYAHQDKIDDKLVGIKSTALLFGNKTILALSIFSVITVSGLLLSGYNNGSSAIYHAGILLGCVPHIIWQLANVDINSQQSCARFFRANSWLGAIIFASLLADYLYSRFIKSPESEELATAFPLA